MYNKLNLTTSNSKRHATPWNRKRTRSRNERQGCGKRRNVRMWSELMRSEHGDRRTRTFRRNHIDSPRRSIISMRSSHPSCPSRQNPGLTIGTGLTMHEKTLSIARGHSYIQRECWTRPFLRQIYLRPRGLTRISRLGPFTVR